MAPMKGKKSPVKGRTFDRTAYTDDEVRDLLLRTASDASSAIRNRAMFTTLWRTGLQISELLALRLKDWDPENQEVRVGRRRIPVDQETTDAIDRWLLRRERLGLPSHRGWLFSTFSSGRGGQLQGTYVRTTLNRLARRADWKKRAFPGGFRQTYAANEFNKGTPIGIIQERLGHETRQTTTDYLERDRWRMGVTDDIVLWACLVALVAMAVALVAIIVVILGDWRYHRHRKMIEELERSREALMNMTPITVRIGTPLYDQDLED